MDTILEPGMVLDQPYSVNDLLPQHLHLRIGHPHLW